MSGVSEPNEVAVGTTVEVPHRRSSRAFARYRATIGSVSNLVDATVVADRIASTKKHVYALAKDGRIPHYRIGTMIRFCPKQIEAWLEGCAIK